MDPGAGCVTSITFQVAPTGSSGARTVTWDATAPPATARHAAANTVVKVVFIRSPRFLKESGRFGPDQVYESPTVARRSSTSP